MISSTIIDRPLYQSKWIQFSLEPSKSDVPRSDLPIFSKSHDGTRTSGDDYEGSETSEEDISSTIGEGDDSSEADGKHSSFETDDQAGDISVDDNDLTNATPLLASRPLELANKFACIAMLEAGSSCNLDPKGLQHVLAVSSGNSIFAARSLCEDPSDSNGEHKIKRIIGNLGRPGITMLIPAAAPRIRRRSDEWLHIRHLDYDYAPEDNFPSTSLHLSLTSFEVPYNFGVAGGVDAQVTLVESLVSVHDKGQWVADLDVLGSLSSRLLHRLDHRDCQHANVPERTQRGYSKLTSIDNWDELLDPLDLSCKGSLDVIRAHENWLARLAAACISIQRGYRTAVLSSGSICLCSLKSGPEASQICIS